MQSIAAQLNETRMALAPVAGDTAALEARVLAAHAWGMTPETLVLYANEARAAEALTPLVQRRLQHEPISQIIGKKDFWRDTFIVTPDVLTPRADSETILETLLRARPAKDAALRMVDLGTGTGCLLLSALREYPNATGVAVDASEKALAVAQQNAAALALASRVEFLCSNWCSNLTGAFDVVISNPPYIPLSHKPTLDADVRDYEPHSALFAGEDGLDDYRSILQQIAPHMNAGALLLFEVGMGQADDVAALGRAHGFTDIQIIPDLAGIARVVALQHSNINH